MGLSIPADLQMGHYSKSWDLAICWRRVKKCKPIIGIPAICETSDFMQCDCLHITQKVKKKKLSESLKL